MLRNVPGMMEYLKAHWLAAKVLTRGIATDETSVIFGELIAADMASANLSPRPTRPSQVFPQYAVELTPEIGAALSRQWHETHAMHHGGGWEDHEIPAWFVDALAGEMMLAFLAPYAQRPVTQFELHMAHDLDHTPQRTM